MAGNDYASVGQRTNAFAAPAKAPKLPSTKASPGFTKTQSVPAPHPVAADHLQRQPVFGRVPRSKFSVVNSGLK